MSSQESSNKFGKYEVLTTLIKAYRYREHLTLSQILFLLCWFDAVGTGKFGFKGEPSFEEEFLLAVKFIQQIELEWQTKVKLNQTQSSLSGYLESSAKQEYIDLPHNFSSLVDEKLKGEDYELRKT